MDLVDVFAVFALFVFMLSLLCFSLLPFSSVNKDLYNAVAGGASYLYLHLPARRISLRPTNGKWALDPYALLGSL